MRLRFTPTAARQLDQALGYIAERSPHGARHVQERIQVVMNVLLTHPYCGQTTSRERIRRIVVSPYPYAIAYRVSEDEITIVGIRHTSRKPR